MYQKPILKETILYLLAETSTKYLNDEISEETYKYTTEVLNKVKSVCDKRKRY